MYLKRDLAYKFVNEFVDYYGYEISKLTTFMVLLTCGKIIVTEKCDYYDYDRSTYDDNTETYQPFHSCDYLSRIDEIEFSKPSSKIHFEMCEKHFNKTAFCMDEPILSSYGAYEPDDDNIVNKYTLKQACLEQLKGIQKEIRTFNMWYFGLRRSRGEI